MALLAKAGSFVGSGSTGNQSVTGVGFQPAVVLFWWNLLASDTNGVDFALGMGVGISSSARRAVGNYSSDAQATSANAAWNQSTTCIYAPSGSPRADFVSMDSDGFTVNWVTATATVINYLALGGTDLTNVKSGAIAAKTTTGNQAYTGIGFQPTALILFAGKFSTDPLDQSTNGAAMIGFATSSSERGCIAWRNKNGANPQVAKHRQSKAKVAISVTDAGVFTEADFVSFDSDGFTLNFTTAGGSADVVYYIALRGPRFKVSSFNQPGSTGNQGITGAGFTPKASLMLSANDTTANNDATRAHALVSLGIATGTSARGSLWAGESDGVSPTVADRSLDRTKLIKMIANSSLTVNAAADHVSFDSDGQTINWTTVDATARETLVLWIGDAAGAISVTVPIAGVSVSAIAPAVSVSSVTTAVPIVTVNTSAVSPQRVVGAILLSVPFASVSTIAVPPSVTAGPVLAVVPVVDVSTSVTTPSRSVGSVSVPVPVISITSQVVTPSVSLGATTITVPTVSVAASATAPSIDLLLTLPVPAASISVTAIAPTVVLSNTSVPIPAITISSQALAPTVSLGPSSVSGPAAIITVNVIAPNVVRGPLAMPVASIGVTAHAPSVSLGPVSLSVAIAESGVSAISPFVTLGLSIANVPIVTVVALAIAPSVSGAGFSVTVPQVEISTSAIAPAVTLGVVVRSVPATGVSVSVFTPAVLLGPTTITVPVASIQVIVVAPLTVNIGVAYSAVVTVVSKPVAQMSAETKPSGGMTVESKPSALLSRWS